MADRAGFLNVAAIQFAIDGNFPDARYEAESLGARWNGWETPVVTRQTLETLLRTEDPDRERYRLTFDQKGIATLQYLQDPDHEDLALSPTTDGHYDLSELGWVFYCPDEIVVDDDVREVVARAQQAGQKSEDIDVVVRARYACAWGGGDTLHRELADEVERLRALTGEQ